MLCVERPVSPTAREGVCQAAETAFSCQAGELLCPSDAATGWVERCEASGRGSRVEQVCATGRVCNPDAPGCAAECAGPGDCAEGEVCDLGTSLCRPGPACLAADCQGACLGPACVPAPAESASTSAGAPDLACFLSPATAPPASPGACELRGRVNLFPLEPSPDTVGLWVVLRQGEPPYPEVARVQATELQGAGTYVFAGVVTNRRYLLEVEAGALQDGTPTVASLHPGVDLRADLCLAGQFTRALTVMQQSRYDSYTRQLLEPWDARRGLLLGRVRDCSLEMRAVGQATVGVSLPPVPPGRIYYFADSPMLVPDLGLQATSQKGYFAVAGLPACENAVGFRARLGLTPLELGWARFPVRPGAVTFLDLAFPAERLPD
jgi:hypothetical protein